MALAEALEYVRFGLSQLSLLIGIGALITLRRTGAITRGPWMILGGLVLYVIDGIGRLAFTFILSLLPAGTVAQFQWILATWPLFGIAGACLVVVGAVRAVRQRSPLERTRI